jgi:hypothetical protein
MLLRTARSSLSGFIEPCLPSPAPNPPAGTGWIHEIKHDGFGCSPLEMLLACDYSLVAASIGPTGIRQSLPPSRHCPAGPV